MSLSVHMAGEVRFGAMPKNYMLLII